MWEGLDLDTVLSPGSVSLQFRELEMYPRELSYEAKRIFLNLSRCREPESVDLESPRNLQSNNLY